LIHLAERKHPLDCSDPSGAFSSISNCMWLVIITISTVGYGDLSTVTVLGRLLSLLTAFIGLMISATLIGIVQERITLSDDENKVIQVLEEENRMKQY
jgi:voltage-gated potassium channel